MSCFKNKEARLKPIKKRILTIKILIMKTLKPIVLIVLSVLLTTTSCRTEDDLSIDPPVEEAIVANSPVANLMSNVAINDGSNDNIIDSANCLSIQLPVTVIVNSIEITINDDDGYEDIEDIIDLFDDDIDSIDIVYPVTVILTAYSTVVVNSDSELMTLASSCPGENEDDDDIECIDFQYPINASIFNDNNDIIDTVTISNDNDMYEFIEDLDEYLYHIDRMVMNLKRNNYFKNLRGLIVGGMTKMHDNTIPFGKNAIEILVDNTKEYDFPICFDFPAGHLKDNRSLIIGKTAHLNVNAGYVTLDFN